MVEGQGPLEELPHCRAKKSEEWPINPGPWPFNLWRVALGGGPKEWHLTM